MHARAWAWVTWNVECTWRGGAADLEGELLEVIGLAKGFEGVDNLLMALQLMGSVLALVKPAV